MENAEAILELAHTVGTHPSRWVIWDEGFVAGKQDAHLVASAPGSRLAVLRTEGLIALNGAVLREALAPDHGRAHPENEVLQQARLTPVGPVPGPGAFFAADL